MDNIVELGCVTTQEIPPEKILNAALRADLSECVVIGQRPDGSVYFAMSTAEAPSINWLLDCAKRLLMDGIMEGETE